MPKIFLIKNRLQQQQQKLNEAMFAEQGLNKPPRWEYPPFIPPEMPKPRAPRTPSPVPERNETLDENGTLDLRTKKSRPTTPVPTSEPVVKEEGIVIFFVA